MPEDDKTTRLDDAETTRLGGEGLDETRVAPGPVASNAAFSEGAASGSQAPGPVFLWNAPDATTRYAAPRQARSAPAQQPPYVPGARASRPATAGPHRRGCAVAAVVAAVALVAFIAFQLGTCSANARRSGGVATAGGASSPAASSPASRSASAQAAAQFDYGTIVGEKLSNAYALLQHAGVDTGGSDPSISVITSDGKRVVNAANWTVTEASYEQATNAMLLKVTHDGEDLGIDVDSATSQLGDIAGGIGDAVETGRATEGLRDLAGGLSNAVDGLLGSAGGN